MSKEQLYDDDDLALQFNMKPICPFCGSQQENTDLDYMLDHSEEVNTECDGCNEIFSVERYIEVTYTTRAKNVAK